ncbi:TIGR01459 family HAD-type hydrolase [Candidatus Pelagibacter sp.]|nr:TIGR01459 family HAD-type hydrolase [Candidatus Pelagibacter sp.]
MTKNLDKEGLRSIVDDYQLFYVDLWGVVHNGISLHQEAIKALNEITKKNKDYILLTNAPRPNHSVKNFLKKLGMEKEIRDHVFTSGEAALNYLKKNFLNKNFFHVGPPRDFDLFRDFEKKKTENIESSNYILCTGLFDDHNEDLKYYKNLFERNLKKVMICTNPDLIVDRGNMRELCAGSVAMVFEKMGGKVIYFGKPYPEVYNQSIDNKNKKILSIGDNLNTDIKGANLQNFDSLIVSNGIHKKEIQEKGIEKTSKSYEAVCNYIQSELKW